MIKRVLGAMLACLLVTDVSGASPGWTPAARSNVPAAGWPRHVQLADAALLVYPPQVVQWDGSAIAFRSAIALRKGAGDATFGTFEATAVAHVDRIARSVALADVKVTKASLPRGSDAAALSAALAGRARLRIARSAADVARGTRHKPATVAVANPVPRVIVSNVARDTRPDRRRAGMEARARQRSASRG